MHTNNRWQLPVETRAKVTADYWQKKPRKREAILKEIKREESKIDREKGIVVGYARNFEYLFKIEMNIIILCSSCFKDKAPRNEKKDWETINKGEYYDKELCAVYLCYCDECEKKLVD